MDVLLLEFELFFLGLVVMVLCEVVILFCVWIMIEYFGYCSCGYRVRVI